MRPRAVVAEVLRLWKAQDVQSTFDYVAEDVVYVLHFDEDLAPYAGVANGREAMMAAFYMLIEEFDYLVYEPQIMRVDGDVVRVHTKHRYHHRRTGEEIAGSFTTVFTIRDGLVVRCEEFVDRGNVEAFMRLVRQREADKEIVPPPAMPRRSPGGEGNPLETRAKRNDEPKPPPPSKQDSNMPDEEECE